MNTEDNTKYINNKNKLYTFIWLFLIIELAAFFLLAFYVFVPEIPDKIADTGNDVNTIILYLSYFTVIISVPLAYKLYDIKKKQALKKKTINQKTEIYFFTLLIIYSFFEFAAIFTLVAFYINKMNEPLYMFGVVFVAVLLNKPSLKRFLKEKSENIEEHIILSEKEENKSENEQTDNF